MIPKDLKKHFEKIIRIKSLQIIFIKGKMLFIYFIKYFHKKELFLLHTLSNLNKYILLGRKLHENLFSIRITNFFLF